MKVKAWSPRDITMDAGQFRAALAALDTTPDNLAAETGVHRSTLFRYMNGSAQVTPLMVAYLVLRLKHKTRRKPISAPVAHLHAS